MVALIALLVILSSSSSLSTVEEEDDERRSESLDPLTSKGLLLSFKGLSLTGTTSLSSVSDPVIKVLVFLVERTVFFDGLDLVKGFVERRSEGEEE